MNIISHYTGNPMVNNALMTIKALAGLDDVRDITTDVLNTMMKRVCDELPYSLMSLNLRFKSYTMLFTKMGHCITTRNLVRRYMKCCCVRLWTVLKQKATNNVT